MDKIKIIYEDESIILIDKPSGIPTHMLKPDEKGTVVNCLIEHFPLIAGIGTSVLMSGLVHRLDTDTSGLVLAVKDNESFINLRKQFKERKILKEYIALVHGRYNGPKIILNYIGSDPKSKKKVKVYSKETKGARPAVTEIISRQSCENYTLLKIIIKTGVRHQIRVQLANLGYPLVGDFLYQNLKTRKKDQLGLRRHFLHACKLGFFHPKNAKWMEFECKMSEDLNEILRRLFKR